MRTEILTEVPKPSPLGFIWLPQVDPEELETGLTQRSFMTATDSVSKVLTCDQAVDGRDAFVKVTPPHPH